MPTPADDLYLEDPFEGVPMHELRVLGGEDNHREPMTLVVGWRDGALCYHAGYPVTWEPFEVTDPGERLLGWGDLDSPDTYELKPALCVWRVTVPKSQVDRLIERCRKAGEEIPADWPERSTREARRVLEAIEGEVPQ